MSNSVSFLFVDRAYYNLLERFLEIPLLATILIIIMAETGYVITTMKFFRQHHAWQSIEKNFMDNVCGMVKIIMEVLSLLRITFHLLLKIVNLLFKTIMFMLQFALTLCNVVWLIFQALKIFVNYCKY